MFGVRPGGKSSVSELAAPAPLPAPGSEKLPPPGPPELRLDARDWVEVPLDIPVNKHHVVNKKLSMSKYLTIPTS